MNEPLFPSCGNGCFQNFHQTQCPEPGGVPPKNENQPRPVEKRRRGRPRKIPPIITTPRRNSTFAVPQLIEGGSDSAPKLEGPTVGFRYVRSTTQGGAEVACTVPDPEVAPTDPDPGFHDRPESDLGVGSVRNYCQPLHNPETTDGGAQGESSSQSSPPRPLETVHLVNVRHLLSLAGIYTEMEADVVAMHFQCFLDAGFFSDSRVMKHCLEFAFRGLFSRRTNKIPPPTTSPDPELSDPTAASTFIHRIDHGNLLSPFVQSFEESGISEVSDLIFVGRHFHRCQQHIPVLASLTPVSSCLLRIGIGNLLRPQEPEEEDGSDLLIKLISKLARRIEPENEEGPLWLSVLLLCRSQNWASPEGVTWIKACRSSGITELDAVRVLVYIDKGAKWNRIIPSLVLP